MKILALIPARAGSKGVPNKNSKLLGEKPLIVYTIEAALQCTEIDELTVSTDGEEIAEISRANGAKVPFLRPENLATDKSPSIDTVIHAVEFYAEKGQHFDAVCLLQPTCPFRTANDISAAIRNFKNQTADSLISVREVPHEFNPHWTFKADENGQFLSIATGEKDIISRRQELPKAYHRDGSIYIVKTDVLLKSRSLYGEKIAFHTSENPVHINIDTLADWTKAEAFLNV